MKITFNLKSPLNILTPNELARLLKVIEKELLEISLRSGDLYDQIPLKKKDGGVRIINAPVSELKLLQRSVLYNYLDKIKLLPCAYGCGSGKSIIENARAHIKNKNMVSFDIKDFFPSIHYKKILQLYVNTGCSEEVAEILCKITTLDYSLPQGAPTSPYLSNLVLNNLDKRIMFLAKSNRCTYTRYFDDIAISGSERVHNIQNTIKSIIETEGYKIKKSKSFTYNKDEDKKITGIIIRKDGTLDIDGKEKLMDYLKELKKFGISYLKSSVPEKEKQSLGGKIAFISSVNKKYGKSLQGIFNTIDWKN
jgi:RNA-directed DNA polymerase